MGGRPLETVYGPLATCSRKVRGRRLEAQGGWKRLADVVLVLSGSVEFSKVWTVHIHSLLMLPLCSSIFPTQKNQDKL
jgi:hypothetical protein